ncbi:MAG: J domain-containing protein [Alphaproteobacteria bacterium]|nr:J domain-containing protein [Alphaproteobacteria bacterium]
MAKRKKSETVEPSGHRCNWGDCLNAGDFRAPRSRNNLREYQWFCEEHIVAFNKSWNYFEGMGEAEIYAFQRDATTGHRPTWRMDQLKGNPTAKLEEAFGRMFGDGYAARADAKPIGAREKDALAVLDLEHPSDRTKIKAQYRELVKKYHPDVNRGNMRSEETFKKITHAYHHLLVHYLEK